MIATLLNVLTGSGLKMLAFIVKSQIEGRQKERLASLNASNQRIKHLMNSGDSANNWTKHTHWTSYTRRTIAFMLMGTFCFVVIWHVIIHPEIEYTILVPKSNSFLLSLFVNVVDKTTIKISAGSLIWDFQNFIGIVTGFYFTPMGSSK